MRAGGFGTPSRSIGRAESGMAHGNVGIPGHTEAHSAVYLPPHVEASRPRRLRLAEHRGSSRALAMARLVRGSSSTILSSPSGAAAPWSRLRLSPSLAAWGRERALRLCLHVDARNTPARAFNDRFGLKTELYRLPLSPQPEAGRVAALRELWDKEDFARPGRILWKEPRGNR